MAEDHETQFLILMYHLISEAGSREEARYCCPPRKFSRHLTGLSSAGYTFVSLSEIRAHLDGRRPLPRNAVALTFDDGFRNIYEQAFPLLSKYKVPATIFLVSGLIGKTNVWMANEGYPDRPMLTWDQVREMQRNGIEIGGHTCTHPRLPALDEEQAIREIAGCKEAIQEQLGSEIHHFAYPYGALSEPVRAMVEQAGFQTACSIHSGFNRAATDPFVLRRIEIKGTDSVRQFRWKVKFGKNQVGWAFSLKCQADRTAARILQRR